MNTYKFQPCQLSTEQTVYVQRDRYNEFVGTYFFSAETDRSAYLAKAIADGWVKN